MKDNADGKLKNNIEQTAGDEIGGIEIAEINELRLIAQEDFNEFKKESDKLRGMLEYYKTEKNYGAEIDKVISELVNISEELGLVEIQQEKDFIVERIRIWNERLEKVRSAIEDLDSEIKSVLVGKWLSGAEKEAEEMEKQSDQPAAVPEADKKVELDKKQKPPSAQKELRTGKPIEFSFDRSSGLLKLPGGIEVDVKLAKGHCEFEFSEADKNVLEIFIIEGRLKREIRIKAIQNNVVKIQEWQGENSQVLTFNKPLEAKNFIERFIRNQLTAPKNETIEIKPAAKKLTEVKKEQIKKNIEPKLSISEPVKTEPIKIEIKKEIVPTPVKREVEEEKIKAPGNFGVAEIINFFQKRQDDSTFSNYGSVARDMNSLQNVEIEKRREVVIKAVTALDKRLKVAETLKNSSDKEQAKKWKIEEVEIAAYKEFLQKYLEKLPPEALFKAVPETEEVSVEAAESEISAVSPPEELEIPIEVEAPAEFMERDEKITKLNEQLGQARQNLILALSNRERSGGIWGGVKSWLGSTHNEVAEIEYENAWEEYEKIQKDLLELTQEQVGAFKNFLDEETKKLQNKIGEHFKGKENIVVKIWKRLGELNLYNYLEKKNKNVTEREKSGEIVRGWDKFWANRGLELEQSGLWAKIGAKALSARMGISFGLLGVGLYEVPGLVTSQIYIGARTAFVGAGAAFGGRAGTDVLQNLGQRWLGKREEIFNSREEAESVWLKRLGLAEEATGGDLDLPSGKDDEIKIGKRYRKLENALDKVEAAINMIMDLPTERRLLEIQHRIAAIEAYAYVNGFDLEKDDNYQRLTQFRDRTAQEVIKIKAEALGDNRETIRPDNLVDALVYLESRKSEMDILSGKITGEKQWRWGKRIASVVIGAAAGSLAYLSMLNKAAAFEIKHQAGGKIIGGGEVGETNTIIDKLVDKYHYPAEGMSESLREQVKSLLNGWEQHGLSVVAINKIVENGLTDGEIADINRLLGGVAGHREALATISRTLEKGTDSSAVLKTMLVQTGRGSNSIEGLIQKQLKLNPEAYGYDLKSRIPIDKWAGHQASVLAREQRLADKYFVFNKNKDQFVILRPDGKIELVGKTYVSETQPIDVRSEYEMSVKDLDKMLDARQAGDAVTADKILEASAKNLTDQDKVWLDKHWQTDAEGGKFLSAEDYNELTRTQARGHVYEAVKTGKQYHADELDIVPSAAKTTVVSGADKTTAPLAQAPAAVAQEIVRTPAVEAIPVLGPNHPEFNFSKGKLSVNLNFEYGVGGKVIGYEGDFRGFSENEAYNNFYRTDYSNKAEDLKPLLRSKNLALSKEGEILKDLKARGLGSSSEAEFLKEKIRRNLESIAQVKNTKVQNLFKQNKLVEVGLSSPKS